MCGIVGSWHNKIPKDYRDRFDVAIDSMKSRGPDSRGCFIESASEGTIAFGHRRLSIIDLSNGGHQPMHSLDKRYSIIFNGMIYNFKELRSELNDLGVKFLSSSDTEVLLSSWITWKENCLSKIVGMFSFVIFDRHEQNFICVRDRFGMKPFFYSLVDNNFIFASEASAIRLLLDNKAELNLQRCYDYLVFGDQDNTNETFVKNVMQLPAGCLLKFNFLKKDKVHLRRWWYPAIEKNENIDFEKAANILKNKFFENIQNHLRSDVSVGAALSGGIDSSSTVCAIRSLYPNREINTFSYIAKKKNLSEEKWVDIINDYTKAKEHKIFVDIDNLSSELDNIIKIQGEPFLDTSILAEYLIFKEAKKKGIKVILEGQGGDELLGGYYGYPGARLHSLISEKKYLEAYKFSKNWKKLHNKSSFDVFSRIGQEILSNPLKNLALNLIGKNTKPDWINYKAINSKNINYTIPNHIKNSKTSKRKLISKLRANIFNGGLPALLRYADRSSMSFSIECRLPFLTSDIAEFMFSLPEEFLVSKFGETKYIFRHSMKGIVPDQVLNRNDKIGFTTPEEEWLKLIKPSIKKWLEKPCKLSFLNKDNYKKEILLALDEKKPYSNQIWRMINFYRWVQINNFDQ